ncbi:serine/threonine-protein phosphatase 2A activator 2 [Trichomonascus vanleenenianus]|uniref:peptidylprolyl isomerase RRD2 n=1 Tax=Trichomonascus vanleenenianus TaxID=2268995 RepID=UPI003ECA2724
MTGEGSILPVRRIVTPKDLEIFKESKSKDQIFGFIKALNEAVIGQPNDAQHESTPVIDSVAEALQTIAGIIKKHPASDDKASRFGKPEFHDFYDEVKQVAPGLVRAIPGMPESYVDEVSTYLIESWGNRTRIDYGSGHELNFIAFLLCLRELELITPDNYKAVVLKLFLGYLKAIRKVQTMYWLEPAGSHGVWGLDDYHFLPFMFGSAQLSTHKHLRPVSIHDTDILDMYADKYMYLSCIKFINSVKTASLRWHSPLLDDISGVKKWSKVNEGMIKMYDVEVLNKLPIIQHFMFGSLIPAPEGVSDPPKAGEEAPHVHNNWGDCCGIKLPSAIAASKMQHSNELRPIPFD